MAYYLYLRQNNWAKTYLNENNNGPFASTDTRYKQRPTSAMLKEHRERLESKEKRMKERREVRSQGESDLTIKIDNTEDFESDPFISLSQVGQVDPILDVEHLLGSMVMDELDAFIEDDDEGNSTIDQAIIDLKRVKLQKLGITLEKFLVHHPPLYFESGFHDGQGSYLYTMVNRIEKRIESRDTHRFSCDTCDCDHEMSAHKTCRVIISDSMLNWRLNTEIKVPDTIHCDYQIQSGARLRNLIQTFFTLYLHEPRPIHVILLGGTNDIIRGASWIELKKQIEELEDGLNEL